MTLLHADHGMARHEPTPAHMFRIEHPVSSNSVTVRRAWRLCGPEDADASRSGGAALSASPRASTADALAGGRGASATASRISKPYAWDHGCGIRGPRGSWQRPSGADRSRKSSCAGGWGEEGVKVRAGCVSRAGGGARREGEERGSPRARLVVGVADFDFGALAAVARAPAGGQGAAAQEAVP